MDYLAFILGDDYVLSVLEMEAAAGTDKESDKHTADAALPAIYEKMLKTTYSEPERLKEIRVVMDKIADSEIIPEEFVQLYNTFAKTLKLK